MRVVFAGMMLAMGPVMWLLQRFKLDLAPHRQDAGRAARGLRKNNPFKAAYQPTEHDVFVVTYVKSGTNWMMQLAHQLLFTASGEYEHIHCVVAWPDTKLMGPMANYAIPVRGPARLAGVARGASASIKTALLVGGRAAIRRRRNTNHRDPRPGRTSSSRATHFFVKDGPFRASPTCRVARWLETFLSGPVRHGRFVGRHRLPGAAAPSATSRTCSSARSRRCGATSTAPVRRVAAFLGVDVSPGGHSPGHRAVVVRLT